MAMLEIRSPFLLVVNIEELLLGTLSAVEVRREVTRQMASGNRNFDVIILEGEGCCWWRRTA